MTEIVSAMAVLGSVVVAMLLILAWNHLRRPRGPRMRSRRLPRIGGDPSSGVASTITVAGRTYNVVEREADASPRVAPCPWCLGSVDPAGGDVVVCRNPHCRRAAHRRCNKENKGCGGVCAVLG